MLTRRFAGQGSSRLAFGLLLCMSAAGLLLLAACSDSPEDPPPGTTAIRITNGKNQAKRLFVEIADTQAERSLGLSGRESLGADSGMLFVFQQRGGGFWMKDTLVPLSVAFIGPCGEIVALADMEPLTLDLHNTDRLYSFGLEVNRGWFDRQGIGLGDQVTLPPGLKQPGCP